MNPSVLSTLSQAYKSGKAFQPGKNKPTPTIIGLSKSYSAQPRNGCQNACQRHNYDSTEVKENLKKLYNKTKHLKQQTKSLNTETDSYLLTTKETFTTS